MSLVVDSVIGNRARDRSGTCSYEFSRVAEPIDPDEPFWLVDLLDGTEITVNIAFIEKRPSLSLAPPLNKAAFAGCSMCSAFSGENRGKHPACCQRGPTEFEIVASPSHDMYPRSGKTFAWDTPVGHSILVAAASRNLLLGGSALSYVKPQYENPQLIVRVRM